MKLWIVSETSKCDTDPSGSCQKGPVAHPGAKNCIPSPVRQRFAAAHGASGQPRHYIGGSDPDLAPGTFHDDNWQQTTQSDDSPSQTMHMVESKVNPALSGER